MRWGAVGCGLTVGLQTPHLPPPPLPPRTGGHPGCNEGLRDAGRAHLHPKHLGEQAGRPAGHTCALIPAPSAWLPSLPSQ